MEDSQHRVETVGPGPGRTQGLVVDGHEVVLCNVAGELYALQNACSHAAAPLDGGRLRGHQLECPLHGAVFDVRSGIALTPPARKPLDLYRVERRGHALLIQIPRQPTSIPGA